MGLGFRGLYRGLYRVYGLGFRGLHGALYRKLFYGLLRGYYRLQCTHKKDLYPQILASGLVSRFEVTPGSAPNPRTWKLHACKKLLNLLMHTPRRP